MTAVDEFFTERGPRVERGRYVIGDDTYTRATTHADTLDDKTRLHQWELRETVHGVARRPDLVARASTTDPSDKQPWEDILEQGRSIGAGNQKANWGTALHAAFERWARTNVFPEDADARVRNGLIVVSRELARLGIKIHARYTERVVINSALGVAGTTDGVAELADGTLVIFDFKPLTEHLDLSAPKWVVQMADYAHADTMILDNDVRIPMPPVSKDVGIIIMVGLHGENAEVDIREAPISIGRHGAILAQRVRQWRRETARNLLIPFTNSPRTQEAVRGAGPLGSPTVIEQVNPVPVVAEVQRITNSALPDYGTERVGVDSTGVAWRAPIGTTDEEMAAAGLTPVESMSPPPVERPAENTPLTSIYLPKGVPADAIRQVVQSVTGPVWAAQLNAQTDGQGHLRATVPTSSAQAVQDALVAAFAQSEQHVNAQPTSPAPAAAPFPQPTGGVPVPTGGSDPVLPATQREAQQPAPAVTGPRTAEMADPQVAGANEADVEALLKRYKGKAEMQEAARKIGVTDLAHTRKVLAQAMVALADWPQHRATVLGHLVGGPVQPSTTSVVTSAPSSQVASMPPAETGRVAPNGPAWYGDHAGEVQEGWSAQQRATATGEPLSPQAQRTVDRAILIQQGVHPDTGQPLPGAPAPTIEGAAQAAGQMAQMMAPAVGSSTAEVSPFDEGGAPAVDPNGPEMNPNHPLITELVKTIGQAVTKDDLTAVWRRATGHGLTWETAGNGALAAAGRMRHAQITAAAALPQQ